jgi:hypothetical protein
LIRTYQRHRDDIVVGRIGGAGLQLLHQTQPVSVCGLSH